MSSLNRINLDSNKLLKMNPKQFAENYIQGIRLFFNTEESLLDILENYGKNNNNISKIFLLKMIEHAFLNDIDNVVIDMDVIEFARLFKRDIFNQDNLKNLKDEVYKIESISKKWKRDEFDKAYEYKLIPSINNSISYLSE